MDEENKDVAIKKMREALQDMCDCAAGFAGKETIDSSEFMEKAGPVVANAASVLGEVEVLLGSAHNPLVDRTHYPNYD